MDYTKLISDDVFCFKLINNDIIIGKVVGIIEQSILLISRPLELVFIENDDEYEDFDGFGKMPTSFYFIPYLFPAISIKTVIPINMAHVIIFNKVTSLLRKVYFETLKKLDNIPNDIDDEAFVFEKENEQENEQENDIKTKRKRYLH